MCVCFFVERTQQFDKLFIKKKYEIFGIIIFSDNRHSCGQIAQMLQTCNIQNFEIKKLIFVKCDRNWNGTS